MKTPLVAAAILLAMGIAHPQTQPGDLSFEVASVKPITLEASASSTRVLSDSTFRITITLDRLIQYAYGTPGKLLICPDWMTNLQNQYRIDAKLPGGSKKEQIPGMLRRLLADRFHLVVHREDRDAPIYALMIDKDGLKVKLRPVPADVVPTLPTANFHSSANLTSGRIHYEGPITLTRFVKDLDRFMNRPVVNMTGMEGEFEIVLDARIPPNALIGRPMFMLMTGGIVGGSPNLDPPLRDIKLWDGRILSGDAPSIFSEIRKLGLALDPTKTPLSFFVVDKADRIPTENH